MSLHADLLKQARHLATWEAGRPSQASLRRAISTAYYALFHLLVHEGSSRFLGGTRRARLRECLARAFIHAEMRTVSQQFATGQVSPKVRAGLDGLEVQEELARVADAFVDLQQVRHEADYDTGRRFTRQEALDLIGLAEQAFTDWRAVRTTLQADAFLVALLAQRTIRT